MVPPVVPPRRRTRAAAAQARMPRPLRNPDHQEQTTTRMLPGHGETHDSLPAARRARRRIGPWWVPTAFRHPVAFDRRVVRQCADGIAAGAAGNEQPHADEAAVEPEPMLDRWPVHVQARPIHPTRVADGPTQDDGAMRSPFPSTRSWLPSWLAGSTA